MEVWRGRRRGRRNLKTNEQGGQQKIDATDDTFLEKEMILPQERQIILLVLFLSHHLALMSHKSLGLKKKK